MKSKSPLSSEFVEINIGVIVVPFSFADAAASSALSCGLIDGVGYLENYFLYLDKWTLHPCMSRMIFVNPLLHSQFFYLMTYTSHFCMSILNAHAGVHTLQQIIQNSFTLGARSTSPLLSARTELEVEERFLLLFYTWDTCHCCHSTSFTTSIYSSLPPSDPTPSPLA
jgi:hypothetical protein